MEWWDPILSGSAGPSSCGMSISASVAKQVFDSSEGSGALLRSVDSTLADLLGVELEEVPAHQPISSHPGLRHLGYGGRVCPHQWRYLMQFILGILNNLMEGSNLSSLTKDNACPDNRAVVGKDPHCCQTAKFRQGKSARQADEELYVAASDYHPGTEHLTG